MEDGIAGRADHAQIYRCRNDQIADKPNRINERGEENRNGSTPTVFG